MRSDPRSRSFRRRRPTRRGAWNHLGVRYDGEAPRSGTGRSRGIHQGRLSAHSADPRRRDVLHVAQSPPDSIWWEQTRHLPDLEPLDLGDQRVDVRVESVPDALHAQTVLPNPANAAQSLQRVATTPPESQPRHRRRTPSPANVAARPPHSDTDSDPVRTRRTDQWPQDAVGGRAALLQAASTVGRLVSCDQLPARQAPRSGRAAGWLPCDVELCGNASINLAAAARTSARSAVVARRRT